jgi:hypothetical protein
MACPERALLELEAKQAVKRWTDLKDKVTAAIRDADPATNEYRAQAHHVRTAAKKAQAALDDHVSVHGRKYSWVLRDLLLQAIFVM